MNVNASRLREGCLYEGSAIRCATCAQLIPRNISLSIRKELSSISESDSRHRVDKRITLCNGPFEAGTQSSHRSAATAIKPT